MPALLPFCAAIAARTSRVEIGTAVLLAPLYEPVRLAEDAAVVDLLAEGRLILGLGLGWRHEEFEALGVPITERVARMEDTIATLRQAWSGVPVVGGDTISYPSVSVTPTPARPGGPPIWIGAGEKVAVRRAGRIGDGYLGNFEAPPELFARQVEWALEGLATRGGDPSEYSFAIQLPTFAWPDPDAWERVRDHHYYVRWKYGDMTDARGRLDPPQPPPPLTPELEEEVRAGIVLGTPDEVAERIRAYASVVPGELHYVARLYWPGLDPAVQREALAVFAEQVIPQVRNVASETAEHASSQAAPR
jgi:alkanesulfonate monooxygenase SsuD/methylene tetrahydromethanopterin reductase-like flavin-dependent oxidoreductase (luciferase family)